MNEDKNDGCLPDLVKVAEKFDSDHFYIKTWLPIACAPETLIRKEVVDLPTKYGHFKLHAYTQLTTGRSTHGPGKGDDGAMEIGAGRVHSSCATGDAGVSLL